jgi:hypothetical protein
MKLIGLSWCWSSSVEFLILPTVRLSGRFVFERFTAMLMWGFWGIGFYVYDKEHDMVKVKAGKA